MFSEQNKNSPQGVAKGLFLAILDPRQYDNELFWNKIYDLQKEDNDGLVGRFQKVAQDLQRRDPSSICDESEAVETINGATVYYKFDRLIAVLEELSEQDKKNINQAISGAKNPGLGKGLK